MAILNIQTTIKVPSIKKTLSRGQETKLLKTGIIVTFQPGSSMSCLQCQPWNKSGVVYEKFPSRNRDHQKVVIEMGQYRRIRKLSGHSVKLLGQCVRIDNTKNGFALQEYIQYISLEKQTNFTPNQKQTIHNHFRQDQVTLTKSKQRRKACDYESDWNATH